MIARLAAETYRTERQANVVVVLGFPYGSTSTIPVPMVRPPGVRRAARRPLNLAVAPAVFAAGGFVRAGTSRKPGTRKTASSTSTPPVPVRTDSSASLGRFRAVRFCVAHLSKPRFVFASVTLSKTARCYRLWHNSKSGKLYTQLTPQLVKHRCPINLIILVTATYFVTAFYGRQIRSTRAPATFSPLSTGAHDGLKPASRATSTRTR
jgi:hypothetical protein